MNERIREIRDIVASVHERGGFKTPPFDFAIYKNLYPKHVIFHTNEFPENADGSFRVRNGFPTLIYRRSLSEEERRYRLAHVAGHALVHKKGKFYCSGRPTGNTYPPKGEEIGKEEEADLFAIELLMPFGMIADELTEQIHGARDPGDIVEQIARKFGVPLDLAELRLSEFKIAGTGEDR
jgi:Zn-dependent peptidase ImmA (M78 family)